SNRGAAITRFQLARYQGDEGEPLDLLQTVDHPRRTLPLQLLVGGARDERLYAVERDDRSATLRWSDGLGNAVVKTVRVPESGYGVDVTIQLEGELSSSQVSVGTGLRDLGDAERDSRLAVWGDAVVGVDGRIEVVKRRKPKQGLVVEPQQVSFAGFQDAYFLSVLRPRTAIAELRVEVLETSSLDGDGKPVAGQVLQVLLTPAGGTLEGQLLGAPKEYDLLHAIGGGIERTLDFGLFGPISVLFLKVLRWIYGVVGNYGFAIVLLTLAIRILLFPLMHSSTVSMRRMQKLQPKVKELQARYKKKKGDPQARAKMNQEMMALYKEEGVNPMGGCLPMLVQLPILWALYKLFLQAIELRHAPFFGWIQDLSAKDPYYITPILMTATMWLQQRLAPQVGDPQQQRIMRLLPFIFGFMFLQFPSGLVLYWLTNNVLTIVQQEVTFRLLGERGKGGGRARQGKDTQQ
ncbi:MAG TPA: membrane protein insertase YidC, partial [Thermoanaerobaculales bacterium]|nr:membrane protein insertase YidC [Thermoanaerobaculales bacterium]